MRRSKKLHVYEGFTDSGKPDMKYYAFDWDDNILHMPTKIRLKSKDGDLVEMSTEDFATYRSRIGKEDFDYEGETVVGFYDDPFRNFTEKGDKQFLIDCMMASPGPAWSDFVEAINSGSVFAIITARGHTPSILKEACYNFIISNYDEISSDELVENLVKYIKLTKKTKLLDKSKKELIEFYLNMCQFSPVSYNNEEAAKNPEIAKIKALNLFEKNVRRLSDRLGQSYEIENEISGNFTPTIGFSDDDPKNVEMVKKHVEKDPESIIQTYSTAGGIKKKV